MRKQRKERESELEWERACEMLMVWGAAQRATFNLNWQKSPAVCCCWNNCCMSRCFVCSVNVMLRMSAVPDHINRRHDDLWKKKRIYFSLSLCVCICVAIGCVCDSCLVYWALWQRHITFASPNLVARETKLTLCPLVRTNCRLYLLWRWLMVVGLNCVLWKVDVK